MKFVQGRVENFLGKGENAGHQHFLLFPKCFPKCSFTGLFKVGIVCKRVGISQDSETKFKDYLCWSLLQHLSLTFDGKTGKLKKMVNLETGVDVDVQQDIAYYFGYQGNCSKDVFQASGAYIFRPNETEPETWKGPSAATQLSVSTIR